MLIWVDYFLAESHLLHSDTRIKWLCKHFAQSVSSEVLLLFPFVPSKPASWLHLISALCIFVTQINLPFAEGQTAKDRTHIVIRASCIQGGKRNCAAAYHQKIPEVSLVYSCSWNSLSIEQYAHNECGDVLQQPQDIVREREARRKSPQTVICNTSALVRYLRPYPDSSGERPSKIARRKESVQNTSGCKWLLLVTWEAVNAFTIIQSCLRCQQHLSRDYLFICWLHEYWCITSSPDEGTTSPDTNRHCFPWRRRQQIVRHIQKDDERCGSPLKQKSTVLPHVILHVVSCRLCMWQIHNVTFYVEKNLYYGYFTVLIWFGHYIIGPKTRSNIYIQIKPCHIDDPRVIH